MAGRPVIRSMTGFGAAGRELQGGTVSVELRSVNHRHLNLTFRLPVGGDAWEARLRSLLGRRIRRGHVTVLVAVEAAPGGGTGYEIDRHRARATLDGLRALREELEIPGRVDLGLVVAAAGELLHEERRDDLGWVDPGLLDLVVDGALDELIRMRELEGARLEDDLRAGLEGIEAAIAAIRELAPERLIRERDRLRRAVADLSGGLQLDEGRLEQEIALLADKWDIGEEVVRATSHLEAFRELLNADADEPVGKRLAFVLQELNREVNTVGAKANDTRISRHVVEAKNGLERLREQVENIE